MNDYDYDPNFYDEILTYYEYTLGRLAVIADKVDRGNVPKDNKQISNVSGVGCT